MRSGRRTASGAVIVAALLGACTPGASSPAPAASTDASLPPLPLRAQSACPADAKTVRIAGRRRAETKIAAPSPGTVIDARDATFDSYPYQALYPFSVGASTAPQSICVVGGIVVGRQPRSLSWDRMKRAFDGDGLRIAGNDGYGVDGLRVDNVSDGVAPRGTKDRVPADGDGFVFRNLYFRYIRDDCVENDEIAAGAIYDSLFDGCYSGISERPSDGNPQWRHPAPPGETLLLDGVLLRLEAMPGPRGTRDPGATGHGQLFKWSEVANRLDIRRSVFLVESMPNSTSFFPFPAGTRTEDVTIVWLGPGPFAWPVPRGTTVTTDRAIWDRARDAWLARHGCASFLSCSKLHDPDPA